ncbi:uncharacterized protein HD556DRAFT_1441420 [Suillus plorans]|uniref:Uncharacterized protein n=1 Tax=Suillus plorans TaxID=116603 RepID=A0A9P7DJZ8_9AGAM|nr:uncharacterized protein HD556DRAFT_1441420 [Suillus plorans]KAG1796728.1 hypothetical protein HD556DRAFT_1441420 [Suillus plorans]
MLSYRVALMIMINLYDNDYTAGIPTVKRRTMEKPETPTLCLPTFKSSPNLLVTWWRWWLQLISPAKSRKGMKLVNGHTINSAVLARYLSWLPNQDEASILKLLNPDDPQDVPRAIEFGITRMRGQHNSDMNYSQALDRIGAAKDIDTVFKKHPDLETQSYSWVGDVVVSHCDLPSAWKDGCDKALTVLTDAHMSAVCCAFNEFFSQDGCDLMRPWGANKYLGISDVEGVELSTNSTSFPNTAVSSESLLLVAGPTSVEEEPELDKDVLTLEEALTHDVAFGSPNIDHDPTIPSTSHPDTPALVSGPGINPDDYLLVYGKYIYKETICRWLLNKHFIAKSLNRQERVYSIRRSITGGNTFIIGDIFLTIIRINLTLTIALVCSTSIEHHSITCHHILASNVCTPDVKLTGQILTLIPTHQPVEQCSWLWMGDYVKTRSEIQGIKQTTEKVVEITAPGLLVELVNPETTCVRMRNDINSDKFFALNNLGNTWIIEELALSLACDTLWRNACGHSISIKNILHIPTPSDPSMFPYTLPDGSAGIICIEASKRLAASESGPSSECPLCGNKTDSMRAHVGIHILRASRGVTSINNNLKQQVGLHQPCGFCGRSGHQECKIRIKITNSGAVSKVESSCPYAHTFQYPNADIGSNNRPCGNVSLKCELCHPFLAPVTGKKSRTVAPFIDAVWHYNMIQHLEEVHPQYAHPEKLIGHPLPAQILTSFTLTALEQEDANIPMAQWLMPLFEGEKENVQVGSSSRKRKTNNAGVVNAKKACTSV